MPCLHKFSEDLQLGYVDWKPLTLFIGTFNPEWGECDNNAQWFYGRTQRNDFWCILPTLYGQHSLTNGNRLSWIEFCRKNRIAITDIISSIEADVNNANHREVICKFKDDAIADFEVSINNITAILDKFPSIKQICITRQSLNDFWEECFLETLEYIQLNQNRQITLRLLRSPSRGARRGVIGNFCQFIAQRWLQQGFEPNP